jgi:hypothetical protein
LSKLSRLFSPGLRIFAYKVFGLAIIFLFVYGCGMLLNLFTLIAEPKIGGSLVEWVLYAALIFLLPITVIIFCYRLCAKTNSWMKRGWIIYAAWVILAFGMSYLVSSALCGMSQAAVEGVTSGWHLELQSISMAAVLLLFSQLFIVPWVLIVISLLKKIGEDKLFPSEAANKQ